MKLFSEDETMISNSVGSELSLARSPLEEQPRTSSPRSRGTESSGCFVRGSGTGNLDSPTKARRMSFKVKINWKATYLLIYISLQPVDVKLGYFKLQIFYYQS